MTRILPPCLCGLSVAVGFIVCSINAHSLEKGDIEVEQLTPTVYVHRSEHFTSNFGRVSSNGLIVRRNLEVYLVDTPWSLEDTAALIAWIKAQGYTLRGAVVTHFHEDRTGGMALLNSLSVPTYASEHTNALLREQGRATARYEFSGEGFWWLGDLVEVYFAGAGHTHDNRIAWIPSERILFGGCLVRNLSDRRLGFTGHADLEQWPHTMARLQHRYGTAAMVVPGHGEFGGTELLQHTLRLAKEAAPE